MEFLKANGIEDHSFVKEMDYQVSLCKTFCFWKNKGNKAICLLFQEVLNSQEIFGDELAMFAKKELQKEVSRGEQEESVLLRRSPGDGEGRKGHRFGRQSPPGGGSEARTSRAAAAVELFN